MLAAADEEAVRAYTTREERREAGLQHELTPWLTVAGLAEIEQAMQRYDLHDTPDTGHDDDLSASLQLGLDLDLPLQMHGELVFEYENHPDRFRLDEGLISYETGDFDLELGRLYIPFGEYFSHFPSGPLLEFGETRGDGLILSWGPDERLDLAAFLYRGQAQAAEGDTGQRDYGLAIEAKPLAMATVGMSALSDLADSDERLLDDHGDRYARRVPALSAHASAGLDDFEMTAEYVCALRAFHELDADRNRPAAWNLELAWYPSGPYEWALRVEGSDELEDAPHRQAGASFTWRFADHAFLALEYLQGRFRHDLAEDSAGHALTRVRHLGAQLSVEF
jgi:hypothetical protein